MTTISDPGSSPPTEVFSVASIPDLVRDGLLDATDVYQPEPGRPRYFWPANDEVVITVPGLPEDCAPIEAAIREYMGFIGTDGHIRFPVKDIELIEHRAVFGSSGIRTASPRCVHCPGADTAPRPICRARPAWRLWVSGGVSLGQVHVFICIFTMIL